MFVAPPLVLEYDNMAIKPRKEIEARENKCFHAEAVIDFNPIPYEFNNLTNELSTDTICNHTYGDHECWDTNVSLDNQLQNPSEKHPVSIAEFFGKYLDLEPVRHVFESRYGNIKYHFRFPLDAMIKASMVRRIKCMRSFQKLVNRFETHTKDAESIGFMQFTNGKFLIPDRRTFWHWENVRVNNQTLENAMDLCIISIRKELEKHGELLGRRIGIDSTPLESLFNDEDATYNAHYDKYGYKIHGAYDLDRNIPLAIIITPMNAGDSPYFKPLLMKLHDMGIKFEKIYADGAYDSYQNFCIVHLGYGAKFITNPGKTAVFNPKGTPEGIQNEYNKLRKKNDFRPPDQVTIKEKLEYLIKYEKYEAIGAYFRNKYMEEWKQWQEEKKEGNQIAYNERNAAEGVHGFVKKYLNLQDYFDYRGLRNVERHVRWTYLAILGVALARAQNGITEDLTQIAYFE